MSRRSTLLAATSALTALSGLIFWVLAAQMSEPDVVGASSAAWSAITLASIAGGAGAVPSLVALLPAHERPRQLFWGVTATSTLLSALVTIPLVAWFAVSSDGNYEQSVALLAVGSAALLGVGIAVDSALIHLGKEGAVLLRATLTGGGKCLLVPWWSSTVELLLLSIVVPLGAGMIIALALVVRALNRRGLNSRGVPWQRLVPQLALNHLGSVSLAAPSLILPLVALSAWGPLGYAPFFPVWVVAATYSAAAASIGAAFLSHRSHGNTGRLRDDSAMRMLVVLAATVPLAAAAYRLSLPLFAPAYSTVPLSAVVPILVAVPFTVATIAAADVLRARKRLTLAAVYGVLAGAATILLGGAVAHLGAEALGVAYLSVQGGAAVVGLALVAATRRSTWPEELPSNLARRQ